MWYSLDDDFHVLMKKLVEKWHANDFRTKPTVITHLINPIYLLCEFSNVERRNSKEMRLIAIVCKCLVFVVLNEKIRANLI